jgi:NADH-quinone oxidoreductase subunit N
MLTNIYFLLPEIFLTITSVILLGYGVVLVKFDKKRSQINKLTNLTSLSFFFAGLLLIDQLGYSDKISISNGLLISDQSIVFIKLILVLTSGIILLLPNKLKDFEFSQLVLLSLLGMMILISSNDLIMIYLGIELMSLSFYVLASINRDTQHSTEAGINYFLLGALCAG